MPSKALGAPPNAAPTAKIKLFGQEEIEVKSEPQDSKFDAWLAQATEVE